MGRFCFCCILLLGVINFGYSQDNPDGQDLTPVQKDIKALQDLDLTKVYPLSSQGMMSTGSLVGQPGVFDLFDWKMLVDLLSKDVFRIFPDLKITYQTELQVKKFKESDDFKVLSDAVEAVVEKVKGSSVQFAVPNDFLQAYDTKTGSFSLLVSQNFNSRLKDTVMSANLFADAPNTLWNYFALKDAAKLTPVRLAKGAKELVRNFIVVPCADENVALAVEDLKTNNKLQIAAEIRTDGSGEPAKFVYYTDPKTNPIFVGFGNSIPTAGESSLSKSLKKLKAESNELLVTGLVLHFLSTDDGKEVFQFPVPF